jgi:transcriptional regulator GlxA family with amidase domain
MGKVDFHKKPRKKLKVAVVVVDGCQASSAYSIVDILLAAQYAVQQYATSEFSGVQFKLVGLTETVQAYNQLAIGPLSLPEKMARPDVIIIPGSFEAILTKSKIKKRLKQLSPWYGVIQNWYESGAVIATACTGNLIVAQTGISGGRTLVGHWLTEGLAQDLFPNEVFMAEKMLVDHGDLVSCGGAFSVSQLMLYLLQRFFGREICLATAKLMMIEPSFKTQTRFSAFEPSYSHGDKQVLLLQQAMEKDLMRTVRSKEFSENIGISDRQLCRRFKRATGETPTSYLQKIRIEKCKELLESTTKQNKQIVHAIGYDDISTFTKLFKLHAGMTMNEYRARFSVSVVND